MALLTTDDIVNKRFTPTKFREGYDQDEVDDFLDEVVKTLDSLHSVNADLRQELESANQRIEELSRGVAATAESEKADKSETESAAVPVEPTPVVEETAAVSAPAKGDGGEPETATSMLALAQRLHDEYVQNGQVEGEAIISRAREEGDKIVKEAEEEHNRVLAQLEQERALLERKIDELRTFEAEYRAKMREFLEGIIGDLSDGAQQGN